LKDNITRHIPNLGKLGIALFEHAVEPILGNSAIQEIKAPLKQKELRDSLGKALINAEKRFLNEHDNTYVSRALMSLPLSNLPSVITAVQSFYSRPSDPSLQELLFIQLRSILSDLPEEFIQSAIAQYLAILREELTNLPGDFREVISTQATLNISENTARIAETLSRIEHEFTTNRGENKLTDKRLVIGKILQSGLFDIPQFTDKVLRKNLITELRNLVQKESVIAVEGLSGSGKSYLVSSLIETQIDKLGYKAILWYHPQSGDTLDNFLTQVEAFITLTGISTLSKCRELLSLFRSERILLIIDNFEQVEQSSYTALIDWAVTKGIPSSIIVISREYFDISRSLTKVKHFEVRGFDTTELQQYLSDRGINSLDTPVIQKILDRTDGLPLAASLFATLVIDFGRSVDELLEGKMIKNSHLHQWFSDILARIGENEVQLLDFLSHCDVPFNKGIINLAGRSQKIDEIDFHFENLQRKYLVQKYTPYRWNVHRLIASFCQSNIDPSTKTIINLSFANYYEKGIMINTKELIDFDKLNWLILSCKYYQRARKYNRSERILKEISKTIKSRGLYQVIIQLGLVELRENTKRDTWVDYDYAHCCFITGRLRQAMQVIEPLTYTSKSDDWGKHLAVIRLYAEILGTLGKEQIALEKLQETLDNTKTNSAHSTIINHARSVEARLLIRLGNYTQAESICQELLAESAKQKDKRGAAIALTQLGVINVFYRKHELANKQFAEAVQLFRESDDKRGLCWSLLKLAETELSLNYFASCYQHLEESLQISADIDQSSKDYLEQLEFFSQNIHEKKIHKLIESEIFRVKLSLSENLLK
jgi:tetratricopeptide (TPR) repeat protein